MKRWTSSEWQIHRLKTADSTQNEALRLAEQGAEEGTVVVAESQSRGRGRLNREWSSPSGGLWMSIILRPRLDPQSTALLPLFAAYSLSNMIRRRFGLDTYVKWPNDVYLADRKLAGFMLETALMRDKILYALLGVGVNSNFEVNDLPIELRGLATTLRDAVGEVSNEGLMKDFLGSFFEFYERLQSIGLKQALSQAKGDVKTIGREIIVTTEDGEFEGRALDLDEYGGLVVKLRNGLIRTYYVQDTLRLDHKEIIT